MKRVLLAACAAALLCAGFTAPSNAAGSDISARIVNGGDADVSEVPWQVPIMVRWSSQQFCGGTLVAPRWVVTAAHCMFDNNDNPLTASQLKIAYGVTDRSQFAAVNNVNVAAKFVYEGYDATTKFGDIALLRLERDVPLTPTSQFAQVPAQTTGVASWPTNGSLATVSGWGDLSFNGSAPNVLQKADVTVKDNACGDYSYFDVTKQICANGGTSSSTIDTCQGDSGGPMVALLNSVPTLTGVTSAGQGCAIWAYPGIYTRVSAFSDWITAKTQTISVPAAPTSVTATPGKNRATVSWTKPSDGGSSITKYVVTSVPGGASCETTDLSCSVEGLQPGATYAFTAIAVNAQGSSPASASSNEVVPYAEPGQVTNVQVVAGVGKLTLSWGVPAANGDAAFTYELAAKPAVAQCLSVTANSCEYTGLTKNQPYEITVFASNKGGKSVASVPVIGIPLSALKSKGDLVKNGKLQTYSGLKIKKNAKISYKVPSSSSSICALKSSGVKLKKKASTCQTKVIVKNPGKAKTSQVVFLGTK